MARRHRARLTGTRGAPGCPEELGPHASRPLPVRQKRIQDLPADVLVRILSAVAPPETGLEWEDKQNMLLPVRCVSRTWRDAVDQATQAFGCRVKFNEDRGEDLLRRVTACLEGACLRWPLLQELRLEFDWRAEHLETAVTVIARGCPKLRALQLIAADRMEGMVEEVDDRPCLTALASLHELRSLTLVDFSPAYSHWAEGLSSLTSLTHLLLWQAEPGAEALPPGLKDLKIEYADITEVEYLGFLGKLQLTHLDIDAVNAAAGSVGLPSTLEELSLGNCWAEGVAVGTQLPNLTSLNLSHSVIECLPPLATCTRLTSLTLQSVEGLTDLPDLSQCPVLQELVVSHLAIQHFPGLGGLSRLGKLSVKGCGLITSLPMPAGLVSLRELYLDKVVELLTLPGLSNLGALTLLSIVNCPRVDVSEDVPCATALQTLLLTNYELAVCSPVRDLSCLTRLQTLDLHGYAAVADVLLGLDRLSHLECLSLHKIHSSVLLHELACCNTLTSLSITECPGLNVSEAVPLLTALDKLDLGFGNEDTPLPDLSRLTRLRDLKLSSHPNAEGIPGLACLSQLVSLHITSMPSMVFGAELALPPSLQVFHISGCPAAKNLGLRVPLPCLRSIWINGTKVPWCILLGGVAKLSEPFHYYENFRCC